MVVSESKYRIVTLDVSSPTGAVTAALEQAQQMVEAELDRWLEVGEYTENISFGRAFRGYPRATPVHEVLAGPGVEVSETGESLDGFGLDAFWSPIRGARYRQTVTYVGGFDVDDPDIEPLLVTIARLAQRLIQPATLSLPANATSASVGDVSVSFATPGSSALDTYLPGVSAELRGWRRGGGR